MTLMNVSLPQELKRYIDAQTKSGYSTPSEFVRELIREDRKRRSRERLEQLLLEGLDSGRPLRADGRFWADLKREAQRRLRAQSQTQKAKRK